MRMLACLLACLALLLTTTAAAEPTHITVRVLSRDAKFIGSSMGGARIVIADADTGAVLAEGLTEGGTGDTDRIMRQPRERHATLSTADAAAFHTTLDLTAPRRLRVTATGPMQPAHAAQSVSAEQWVLPGGHLSGGDGWLLEMPGFAVTVLHPEDGAIVSTASGHLSIEAEVTMMCGCPLMPGGLWDSTAYEITAVITRDGEAFASLPMQYAGSASRFEVRVDAGGAGDYRVQVRAHDPANGNTGLHSVRYTVP